MTVQTFVGETDRITVFNPAQRIGPATHVPSTGDRMMALADKLASEQRSVTAGAELASFAESDQYVFVVMDGWLMRNALLADGRRQILGVMLPGDLIAGRPTGSAIMAQSVDAITDATVALIPKDKLPEIVQTEPVLALRILDAAQDALNAAYESLVDTGRRNSVEAVANFLYRIESRAADAIGRTANGKVAFPLIQEHIGDATGLTAVHVCRTLRKLKSAGAIEMGRGWLRIADRGLLAEIAGEDEDTGFDCISRPPERLAS